MTKTVLVTGGAGFIGSHFIRHLLGHHDDVEVINVDKLTYSANLANLADVADHPRYRFVRLDLADEEAVHRLFRQYRVDEVVHFAAESHVDRSIRKTDPFIRSNIVGTHRLLEAVREAGVGRMIHVSTDEVYGSILRGRADEQTRLSPGNPYSASKAASDLLCLAYVNTYGLPAVITRCTNNYGPYQHPEKFIPRMILSALQNRPLPIYGGGRQERDWIHVRDHCAALDRGPAGRTDRRDLPHRRGAAPPQPGSGGTHPGCAWQAPVPDPTCGRPARSRCSVCSGHVQDPRRTRLGAGGSL